VIEIVECGREREFPIRSIPAEPERAGMGRGLDKPQVPDEKCPVRTAHDRRRACPVPLGSADNAQQARPVIGDASRKNAPREAKLQPVEGFRCIVAWRCEHAEDQVDHWRRFRCRLDRPSREPAVLVRLLAGVGAFGRCRGDRQHMQFLTRASLARAA